MKKTIKKYNYLLITFIITMISIMLVYILKSVTPFGKNSLLTIDFYHQYGPMLGELYDRIIGKLDLVYSFRMGLGLPFYRNFFNYLSSPVNIIMFVFKHKHLIESFSLIIAVKASLSATTMCYYLNKKFNKNYLFIGLSILYAFSAYFAAYYWNIMWLDGMFMLPLIIYGIEKIVDENKCLLYIISLAIMIFANYYIGYMICIFSIIYFITYLIISTKTFKTKEISKKALYFLISSLLAGGLCAFFILPIYETMKNISATGDTIPKSQYYAFTVKEFIFGHLSGVKTTVLSSDIANAPNVSTSVLSIALLILFLVNKKINYKIKVGYIFLLLFLILSYVIAPIDFIWHGFHTPNDLPFRYSFIYSFIFIVISAYSIDKIKYIKKIDAILVYNILIIFISLANLFNYKCLTNVMLITNYLLITIYFLVYILSYLCNSEKAIKIIKFSLIFIMATESILAMDNSLRTDTETHELYDDYNSVEQAISYLKEKDNSIYRIEKDDVNSYSDPSWYGYNGQVGFSSMEYEYLAKSQKDLGMPGNYINSFYYKENTPIYNIMFNIKYILGEVNTTNNYELYHKQKKLNIYKSKYTAGLIYGVEKNIKDFKIIPDAPLENQNGFIEKATNISEVLEKVKLTSEIVKKDSKGTIVKYKYENDKDSNTYLYFKNADINYIIIQNKLYHPDSKYNDKYFGSLYTETISYNEEFVISVKPQEKKEFYVRYDIYQKDYDYDIEIYKTNHKKLEEAYQKIISNQATITDFKERQIKAKTDFKTNLTMYTSIPYDTGWRVYIDGKKTKTFKIADSLLGFDITSGKHKIVLKYEIPHLKEGVCISIISIASIIIFTKKPSSKQKKKTK